MRTEELKQLVADYGMVCSKSQYRLDCLYIELLELHMDDVEEFNKVVEELKDDIRNA